MKRALLTVAAVCAASSWSAVAQCPQWSNAFGYVGLSKDGPFPGRAYCVTRFDDGRGEALYVGGDFAFAGNAVAASIARWNGASFEALGNGVGAGNVRALAVYDDGAGPALYAAGSFSGAGAPGSNIAKWNGTSWASLGTGVSGTVEALVVFDDGSGPALYVGGTFAQAGGVSAGNVARWDGAWSAVGNSTYFGLHALRVFDDGTGARLYAAGNNDVLRFDGVGWNYIGFLSGGWGVGYALEAFDDGNGAALYVGGSFDAVDAVASKGLARWSGNAWHAVGDLTGATPTAGGPSVFDLRVLDDGSGAQLYAAGTITSAGGKPCRDIARFDGTSWERVGGALSPIPTEVRGIELFDSGAGQAVIVAGRFGTADGAPCNGLARLDGATWRPLDPVGHGIQFGVEALAAVELDGEEQLYASGHDLQSAGGQAMANLVRWDGAQWHPVAETRLGTSFGYGYVHDVEAFDEGSGEALYATGMFTTIDDVPAASIAKFDGASWSEVGGGLQPVAGSGYQHAFAFALAVHDDGSGPALYVGGGLAQAGVERLVRWNGSAWSAVGGSFDDTVVSLIEFDSGSGPELYAGGYFTTAAGTPARGIASWDGNAWSALGAGLDGTATDMAVFDDGSGPTLFVTGGFATAGGLPVNRIARWDGSTWSALPGGVNTAKEMAVWDDGNGPALYVTGNCSPSPGGWAPCLAKWSSAGWSPLGTIFGGVQPFANALAVFHDGVSPNGSLYVGGEFPSLGGKGSRNIGRLENPCACSGTSYCTSGTTSSGCVPAIEGIGRASAASGFEIRVTGVEGDKTGYIVYSVTGPNANPWGASSHFLCVKAPTQRTGTQQTGGTGGQCDGALSVDWNAYVATHPLALGVPFSSGASVWAQGYFRDPPGPKTTALSNGLQFSVCP